MSFADDLAHHFKIKAHNDAIEIKRLNRELARARRSIASLRAMLAVVRNPDETSGPTNAQGEDRRASFGLPGRFGRSFKFHSSPGYKVG